MDVNRAEFFCPLCKSLSNTLIAHVPPPVHAAAVVAANARNRIGSGDGVENDDNNCDRGEVGATDPAVTPANERVMVERLATAEGLAGWVLLEEDGGVGAGVAVARARRVCEGGNGWVGGGEEKAAAGGGGADGGADGSAGVKGEGEGKRIEKAKKNPGYIQVGFSVPPGSLRSERVSE